MRNVKKEEPKTKRKIKIVRRGLKNKNKNIKIFSANANRLGPKVNSLKSHIKSLNISIFTLKETLLYSWQSRKHPGNHECH